MPAKKSPRTKTTKTTKKRHSAVPPTSKPSSSVASAMKVGDAAVDAVASATTAIMESTAGTVSTSPEETCVSRKISASRDSNPAGSAVTMSAPADALPKADPSVSSVMPNTSTAAMVNSLRDTSADTASEAAASLGATRDPSAVKPLMEVVANTDGFFHPVVRAAAATSLGQLADKRAVPTLIAGIRDEMAEASAESIRALAAIGDPRAVAPLIDVVRNADGYFLSFVRRAAVQALVKLGGPEATAALRVVAENYDEDPVIRQVAVDAV